MISTKHIADTFTNLQNNICKRLEIADTEAKFETHPWKKNMGGGLTSVLQNGKYIEKAAVNFSHVGGAYTPQMAKLLGEEATEYAATGVSSIIHPRNVHVPIIHMNVRYFELNNGTKWFGGGIDLTPHYVVEEDAAWFHRNLKAICDQTDPEFYTRFKPWADEYFYLPHRNETRGIGGIFFDRIKPNEKHKTEDLLAFCVRLGEAYPKIYAELIKRHGDQLSTAQEKEWQMLRRGRYVEFNLVYDRGTKFGLESGGNTESILLSMPPVANWAYDYTATPGSKEEATLNSLRKGINWI